MANFKVLKSSFVSGELDPAAIGRVDTAIYAKSADKLRNVYVRPQGGAFRREGLEYIDSITGFNEGRLVPFEFNDEQTYMLVFTAGEFKVYRTDQNSVQATVSSSPVSGLSADIIKEMNWTQSADTLVLVHKDIQPISITRTSDTSWTAANISLTNIPTFAFGSLTTSTPAGSVTPDVKTGRVTVTGSGTTFTSLAVGQYINMPKGGRIFIRSIASDTELEGDVIVELAATSSVSSGVWEYESGYEDVISSSRGWARSVTFYKSRLVFGGLGSRPSTLLFSKIGEFFDFDRGTGLDDEAIDITLDDNKVNIINGLFPGRALQIFTTGGEYTIRSAINDALTPANVSSQLNSDTSHGSGNADSSIIKRTPRPVSVDGATVFAEKNGAVVRQFVYNDSEQSFAAPNISILSSQLISSPVAQDIRRASATNPADFLYLVNDDGTIAVLSSLREQDLLAWSLFDTQGSFEDVAVSGNEAYFIVKRTINSSEVRFLERLNALCFVDAAFSDSSVSPKTSWSGFSHLDGELCKIRGDGFILDDGTPASGAVTTTESIRTFEIGLNFSARVKDLPIELVVQGQSFAGEYKTPIFANILLHESRNIEVVYNNKTFKPPFRQFGSGVLDQPISLFSGWKKVYLGAIKRDPSVETTQSEPLEMNVLAVHYGVKI